MNISRISNVSFNGAYIIKGRGDDVKEAETVINEEIKKMKKAKAAEILYTNKDIFDTRDITGDVAEFGVKTNEDQDIQGAKKAVKEKISAVMDKDILKIEKIGAGYTTVETPAYILVTTGDDIEAYDTFKRRRKAYCNKSKREYPKKFHRADFDNFVTYMHRRVVYEAGIHLKAIKEYCDFKKTPSVLSAKQVLSAIKEDKFDFENGKIKE